MKEEEAKLAGKRLFPLPEVNKALMERGSSELKEATSFLKLLKRPELDLAALYELADETPTVPPAIIEQIEIKCKYEGYIKRQLEAVKQFVNLEKKRLPVDFDYDACSRSLQRSTPETERYPPSLLGQAARISGVTPAAVSILLVYLKRWPGIKSIPASGA